MGNCVTIFSTFVLNKTPMKDHKTIPITTPIDLDKYANIETGETLASEAAQGKGFTIREHTGLKTITSSDYAVIETEAILFLSRILNNSDLANVVKMSVLTRTPLNIVYADNNYPHTHDTLQKYLEIDSKSMFIKLIRRLIKNGILYQIKGKIYGEVRVCYMLNPYLSRKRKQFESAVFDAFERFTLIDTKHEDNKPEGE